MDAGGVTFFDWWNLINIYLRKNWVIETFSFIDDGLKGFFFLLFIFN